MAQDNVNLEEFLSNTVVVLNETKINLDNLVQEALLQFSPSPANVSANESSAADSNNGHDIVVDKNTLRLQQVCQELEALSERSDALQTYLQNGLDTPPPANNHWSRVRILQSQEEERAKLAHQLEDSVGQLLANAVFELASCRHLLSGGQGVADGLESLQTELEQGLTDIRYFITGLEPTSVLGSFGLGGGIRRYLEQYEVQSGLKVRLQMHTNIGRLPNLVEITIFRIFQEILSNVSDHANATQVDIIVKEQDEALQFSIVDNGDGLISDKMAISRKSLGLARVVDYVELLNGDLKVLSEPGCGTQVILSVPYSALSIVQ